jgi:hypothetical protein
LFAPGESFFQSIPALTFVPKWRRAPCMAAAGTQYQASQKKGLTISPRLRGMQSNEKK